MASVSSLQSDSGPETPQSQLDWVEQIQRQEGKESSWGNTKGWSCRWELTLPGFL